MEVVAHRVVDEGALLLRLARLVLEDHVVVPPPLDGEGAAGGVLIRKEATAALVRPSLSVAVAVQVTVPPGWTMLAPSWRLLPVPSSAPSPPDHA